MGKVGVKPLTFEERKLIEKYIKQGLSCGSIAKLINRSKNGIVCEVRKGGRQDYSAEYAQKLTNTNLERKKSNVSMIQKGNDVVFRMKQRIISLEMQVEILHETLQELLKR